MWTWARLVLCAAILPCLACTDASVYQVGGNGLVGPDRVTLQGVACAPIPAGDAFPVKILFAIEGGAPNVTAADFDIINTSLNDLANRSTIASVSYALVAFHTVAAGVVGAFGDGTALQGGLNQFQAFQESGPVSLVAPLRLAETILAGDMETSCKATVQRTHYVVVLVTTDPDVSCANPVFNAEVDPLCGADGGVSPADCSDCSLRNATIALKALAQSHGAGEVSVVPIYYRAAMTPDPLAVDQVNAIAVAAGSTATVVDVGSLKNVLESVDLSSLQKKMVLKRLFAFNRSAFPRGGQQLIDSDEDGIPDVDEKAYPCEMINGKQVCLDPTNADSDGDGLTDGVEIRMGTDPLDPTSPGTLQGCDPTQDTDGDRLNDCEEQLIGTDPCVADTDGDGFSDLVEVMRGTNPLVPENTLDTDKDGWDNLSELSDHTDPLSIDLAYRAERGYWTTISDAAPTADGRACYNFQVGNISLVTTLGVPNPPYPDLSAGNNDIYLYLEMGFGGQTSGEVGSIFVQPIQFTPPGTKSPGGTITITPDEFVLGT